MEQSTQDPNKIEITIGPYRTQIPGTFPELFSMYDNLRLRGFTYMDKPVTFPDRFALDLLELEEMEVATAPANIFAYRVDTPDDDTEESAVYIEFDLVGSKSARKEAEEAIRQAFGDTHG